MEGVIAQGGAMYSTDLWDDNTNFAVLGQFFYNRAARSAYKILTEDYCKRTSSTKKVRSTIEVMEIPAGDGQLSKLHPTFKKKFAAVIDDALIENGKRFPRDKKSLLLEHLPCDLPCSSLLEVYQVPNTDPRVPLRGQNGVRVMETALRGLPPGAFIGVYRGLSLIGLEEYRDPETLKRLVLDGLLPPGLNYLQFELEIESYTASCEHYNVSLEAIKNGITFEGLNVKDPSYSSVHICAARYGNITALVNDPSIDPMGNSDEVVDTDNTCMCEIVVGGWPCIVMFATKLINPGEELRYSYGTSFWTFVAGAMKRLNAVTEAATTATGTGGAAPHIGNGVGRGGVSSEARPAVNASIMVDTRSGNRTGATGATAAAAAAAGAVQNGIDDNPEAAAADVEALADDAATPLKPRVPLPSSISELAPTEEQNIGDGENGADLADDAKSDSGVDSSPMVPRRREPYQQQQQQQQQEKHQQQQEGGLKAGGVTLKSKQQKQQQQEEEEAPKKKRKQVPPVDAEEARTPPSKKQTQHPELGAAKSPLFTPTKEMLNSPHGKRVVIYSKKTPEGKIQAANNGYASQKQFEAAQRLVRENPKIESGAETSSSGSEHEDEGEAAAPGNAAADARVAAPALEMANGGGPAAAAAAAAAASITDLQKAVEAAEKQLSIAHRKLNNTALAHRKYELSLKQLQPVEEEPPQETEPVQPTPAQQAALWTQTRLFALFIENPQGKEVLVGPWKVSQLENALASNQAPASSAVFLHPNLNTTDDVEIREGVESLGNLPEHGMWKLAELLDAAHPEALGPEAERSAAAATAAANAARGAKRKRLNPKLARALKEAEKKLDESYRNLAKKEQLVQEKEEALALAERELRVALGEEEESDDDGINRDKAEIDPEVAKANERAAGKRPAVDDFGGASGSGGGNTRARVVKSPRLTPTLHGAGLGADGAGTSAAHAAQAAAAAGGPARKGGKQDNARPVSDDEDFIDLTYSE